MFRFAIPVIIKETSTVQGPFRLLYMLDGVAGWADTYYRRWWEKEVLINYNN